MKQSTKEKLLKIPVIGQITAAAILPKELKKLQKLQEETMQLQEGTARIQHSADERWQAATSTFDSLGQQIRDLQEREQGRNGTADERWQAATATFDSLGQHIRDVQAQLETAKEELQFSKGFQHLLEDGTALSALRNGISIHRAVWGPEDRLHIDPEASMDSCLFNTNSGSITVGPYTFAGPGVSLIAGNHDMDLTGFPRRDLQPEAGCDIEIGQGVWLCANCTVLGPCRIGDNAVIAAGAVVTPGTEAEAGCLYAGVPAKKIRKISNPEENGWIPDSAFDRFDGCLYTRGWHMTETIRIGENTAKGHWMIREEAEIVCRAGERTLHYYSPLGQQEDRSLQASLGDWTEEVTAGAEGEIRIPAEAFRGEATGKLRLRISRLFRPGNGDPRELGVFLW